MRLGFPLLVICLFLLIGLSGSAQASKTYTFRYHTGASAGGFIFSMVCLVEHNGTEYTTGGACKTPCPDGRCRITVTDDMNDVNVWFRYRVNDAPFYDPGLWKHTTVVEADYVSVAVDVQTGTIGTITIEAA